MPVWVWDHYLIPDKITRSFFWGQKKACFGLSSSGFINASIWRSLRYRDFLGGVCFKGLLETLCCRARLAHAQGYSGKSVGAINTDATACRLEVRWGMKTKGEGTGGLECAVTSVNLKVPFQVQQISSSCSSKFMLGNTFRSALDCFALVLYHTISNSGITKPASLMLVFMLGRQAWYKSEVFFFAFLFFFS